MRVAAEPGAAADPRAGELVVRRRGASAVDEELSDSERIRRFEVTTGVEVFVHGDDSRSRLACRVKLDVRLSATPTRVTMVRRTIIAATKPDPLREC